MIKTSISHLGNTAGRSRSKQDSFQIIYTDKVTRQEWNASQAPTGPEKAGAAVSGSDMKQQKCDEVCEAFCFALSPELQLEIWDRVLDFPVLCKFRKST